MRINEELGTGERVQNRFAAPILPPRQLREGLSLQIGAEIHGQIVLVVFWMCG